MGLFRKKKVDEVKLLPEDYTNWEKELGFLLTKMQRKKNIIKNFFIDIYDTQLVKNTDYIRDEDIAEKIQDSVYEVYTEIGGRYRNHIVDRYFGDDAGLIAFITEDFYVDLTSHAVGKNTKKIRTKVMHDKLKSFGSPAEEEDKKE